MDHQTAQAPRMDLLDDFDRSHLMGALNRHRRGRVLLATYNSVGHSSQRIDDGTYRNRSGGEIVVCSAEGWDRSHPLPETVSPLSEEGRRRIEAYTQAAGLAFIDATEKARDGAFDLVIVYTGVSNFLVPYAFARGHASISGREVHLISCDCNMDGPNADTLRDSVTGDSPIGSVLFTPRCGAHYTCLLTFRQFKRL